MKSQPDPGFHNTFSAPVKDLLVSALDEAYTTAEVHFEANRGNNTKTFGFELYHCAVHELSQRAENSGGLVCISRSHPVFRLRVGAYEIACHKVGVSATQDIWTAFPGNKGAAPALVDEQPFLFSEMEPSVAFPEKLVLAHLGNPEDGLQAVYLCAPAETEKKRISRWAYAECLWSATSTSVLATPVVAARPVPAEVLEEPVVRLKQDKATRDRKA